MFVNFLLNKIYIKKLVCMNKDSKWDFCVFGMVSWILV